MDEQNSIASLVPGARFSTHEELFALADDLRSRYPISSGRKDAALARGYIAIDALLAAAQAENAALRDWRANVTVAVGRSGGCHFSDVASEIRTLRKHLTEAQAGQTPWSFKDCDHEGPK